MTSGLILDNLATYSLQVGLLIALAACVPPLLRLRVPGARLIFWHVLLVVCLLLPVAQSKRRWVVDDGGVQVSTTVRAVAPARTPARWPVSRNEAILLLLAAGAAVRLGWLAVGFWRLRRYRRGGKVERVPEWMGRSMPCPTLLLSDELSSPVTFGWRRPVVLLPARFPELGAAMQRAILCHELLHVQRRDWLFTVAEELVRAVFWFHPAIWWLLGEIQLAREQAVDREVVAATASRDQYVDALLAIAGARPQLDLAPAPLFLRRRHLKQRVVSILKEVRMTKTRWISALAAGLGIVAAACWLVTNTFPLMAAPQQDAVGVTVELGGAPLMHRAPVSYPAEARSKGVQGVVMVEVKLGDDGSVSDAHIVSGPDELRKTTLQSVLQWHFRRELAGLTRQISITFQAPSASEAAAATRERVAAGVVGGVPGGVPRGVPGGVVGGIVGAAPSGQPPSATVKSINVLGLSDQARDELLARLPVHVGDTLQPQDIRKVSEAARAFDEHLQVRNLISKAGGDVVVEIAPVDYQPPRAVPTDTPGRLRIGGNVQQAKLIKQVRPVYPAEAKASRIQGTVELRAIIGRDGSIQELTVVKGHPLLADAALDAVKQWVYDQTFLNGEPIEVETTIDVNFTLSQ